MDQFRWITCAVVTAVLVIGYTFRDTFSNWKELLKAKVRKWLRDKIVDQSIDGDTAKTTSVGFVSTLVQFLDDHFLKPTVEIEDTVEVETETDNDKKPEDEEVVNDDESGDDESSEGDESSSEEEEEAEKEEDEFTVG